ncbi:hypothetical protein KEJ15_00880 [Candidatus Bathyarchaeota archaeon]|nr:hypothetical protein [Candidatus Bathyarchaeota archaeon]
MDRREVATKKEKPLRNFEKNRRAVSPAISTVILTSAIVVLLLATIVFANNFLNGRLGENEFSAMKQFMQTVGLQIDDVAWTIGRTQTIRYASRFGLVNYESAVLNYSLYVYREGSYEPIANFSTGMILFNMPISRYSMGNNYRERIVPSSSSFIQEGTSAPVCTVFVIEKVPMNDGNFIRIVAVPSIRILNSTISAGGELKNYVKLYLPLLNAGNHSYRSQSITLEGNGVSVNTEGDVDKIKIEVSMTKSSLGFDEDFFGFANITEEIDVPNGSIMQFYKSDVTLTLGLHI